MMRSGSSVLLGVLAGLALTPPFILAQELGWLTAPQLFIILGGIGAIIGSYFYPLRHEPASPPVARRLPTGALALAAAALPTLLFPTPPGYLGSVLAAALGWIFGDRLADALLPPRLEEATGTARRVAARLSLTGILLVIVVTVARAVGYEEPEVDETAVLLYLLLAVGLLTCTHYTSLQRSWDRNAVRTLSGLGVRWVAHTLLGACVAAIIGYGVAGMLMGGFHSLLASWSGAGSFIGSHLQHLLQLLDIRATAPLRDTTLPHPPLLPPGPSLHHHHGRATPSHPGLSHPVPWRLLITGLIVTTATGLIAGTAIRMREELKAWMRSRSLPRRLARLAAHGPLRKAQSDSGQLSSRSPREGALYYYEALLRLAAELGVRRAPAQTPEEFEPVLIARLPGAGADITRLTDAFVEARYAECEVEPEEAGLLRQAWQRIQALPSEH